MSTDPIDGIGGPGPGGGAITQAQASGEWSFTLDRTSATCSAGSLQDNQVIITNLVVVNNGTSTGTLTAVTSSWRAFPSTTLRPLDGTLRFNDGVAVLMLRGATTNSAMELSGTFTAAGGFTGVLEDPPAGSLPVFGTGPCNYAATGVKTS